MKAWDVSNSSLPSFQKINKILEKNFGTPVHSLQMTKPDFLVIGLNNGLFSGWNLAHNSFDDLQAHSTPVQALHLFEKFLISGATQEI